MVWVEEEFRSRDIGTSVMKAAEEWARNKKLTGIYLWTQSWQAPLFYQKLGYECFAELRDLPLGHSRIGFRKYLL
jgi:GNAT superfamily N-acetyltransferase